MIVFEIIIFPYGTSFGWWLLLQTFDVYWLPYLYSSSVFSCQFYFSKNGKWKKIQILILLKSQEHFNRGICLLFRADLFFFSSFYALIFWLLHGNDWLACKQGTCSHIIVALFMILLGRSRYYFMELYWEFEMLSDID